MTDKDEQPILFRNTMRITPGHLDGFAEAIDKAVKFTEAHGPQLMVEVFIDEEQLLAYSFQLYADSASILKHWELSDPYIQDVMEHCTVAQFDIYGQPNQTVLDGLNRAGATDFPITMHRRLSGFTRLSKPTTA
ncbi:MAG: hypothetical protein ACRD0P_02930 [Stackebrandtia sp.]